MQLQRRPGLVAAKSPSGLGSEGRCLGCPDRGIHFLVPRGRSLEIGTSWSMRRGSSQLRAEEPRLEIIDESILRRCGLSASCARVMLGDERMVEVMTSSFWFTREKRKGGKWTRWIPIDPKIILQIISKRTSARQTGGQPLSRPKPNRGAEVYRGLI